MYQNFVHSSFTRASSSDRIHRSRVLWDQGDLFVSDTQNVLYSHGMRQILFVQSITITETVDSFNLNFLEWEMIERLRLHPITEALYCSHHMKRYNELGMKRLSYSPDSQIESISSSQIIYKLEGIAFQHLFGGSRPKSSDAPDWERSFSHETRISSRLESVLLKTAMFTFQIPWFTWGDLRKRLQFMSLPLEDSFLSKLATDDYRPLCLRLLPKSSFSKK